VRARKRKAKREISELGCAHWPHRHYKGSKNESICADREQRKADKDAEWGKRFLEGR